MTHRAVPHGFVVHRLVHSGEQSGGVDDLQRGDGLIVAIRKIQQQQLLPHRHAVVRRAADTLEIGADRGGLAAPHRTVIPLPHLLLRHISGEVLLLLGRLVRGRGVFLPRRGAGRQRQQQR